MTSNNRSGASRARVCASTDPDLDADCTAIAAERPAATLQSVDSAGCADRDGVAAEGRVAVERRAAHQRRASTDRRRRVWWSLIYGNFNPRRRAPQRRNDEAFQPTDWHSPHLMAVAMGILLMSVADAFLTITLIAGGAIEVNPVMATVVYDGTSLFAIMKMTMTGFGVICMVFMARYRFLRVIRVETVMYTILIGYGVLLCYELWMLRALVDIPGL